VGWADSLPIARLPRKRWFAGRSRESSETLDFQGGLAHHQTDGRLHFTAGTHGEDAVLGQGDRVPLTEVLDTGSALIQFEDQDRGPADLQNGDDDARQVVARGTTPAFEGTAGGLVFLIPQLVPDEKAKQDNAALEQQARR
jgi:hypothetical protein